MPQGNNNATNNKKKKKGRAPSHQNSFAFKHNPKSKKTERILSAPNTHVCRRCHEKIEWRKKYRKYKPRTQPGKCNLCQTRNVMAAYHTICTTCTTSDKAFKNIIQQEKSSAVAEEACSTAKETTFCVEDGAVAVDQVSHAAAELSLDVHDGPTDAQSVACSSKNATDSSRPCHRVCAMCTKEPALPDQDDDQDNTVDDVAGKGRLKLRERRALERKLWKEKEAIKQARKREKQGNADEVDGDNNSDSQQENDANDSLSDEDLLDGSETEDDLIKAVGGEDKLLTGEAYQTMLLERERLVQASEGD